MDEVVTPRVLLVEPGVDEAELIVGVLGDHLGPAAVTLCRTLDAALSADLPATDIVLCNAVLPDAADRDVLGELRAARADLPVVLLARRGDTQHALRAIREGAYDYLVKSGDWLFALPVAVEKNLAIAATRRENAKLHEQVQRTLHDLQDRNAQLRAAVQQLETMALTDALSGLANRRAFNEALDRSFAEATRHGQDLTLIMIDLDGFKGLNDTCGHQAGDELLRIAGRVLSLSSRRSDLAARYGGDEFAVLLPRTDLAVASGVADRIAEEFAFAAAPFFARVGAPRPVTMSAGLASLDQSKAPNADQLVALADHALYQAKRQRGGKAMTNVLQA